MQRTTKKESLSVQMKRHVKQEPKKVNDKAYRRDEMISTGSTLLDLAISGTAVKGGGIPPGILVEIFGPSSSGKSVLLSEIAGAIQRKNGDVMFHDPEARLNKVFARVFDFNLNENVNYSRPNTVTEVFTSIRKWEPTGKINGIMTDSLAALSTDLEMDNEDGDKMGMRRAKEFSEQLRKTARMLAQKNLLMVCSNQIRQNTDAGPYGKKNVTPGGKAVEFYSSLRLEFSNVEKIKDKQKIGKKEETRIIGTAPTVTVVKSSIDKGYRSAQMVILFDYGIDDIRANLQYIKDHTKNTMYCIGERKLAQSIDDAIDIVEKEGLEDTLQSEVITLWEEIESRFEINRKKKAR